MSVDLPDEAIERATRKILLEQKQHYSLLIDSAYSEIDQIYHELNSKFEQLYPHYCRFDNYEILYVDFWFGYIACDYDGDNYELSNRLFDLTNQLSDIIVYDLDSTTLVMIHDIILEVCKDVYGYISKPLTDLSVSTNTVIQSIKNAVDFIIVHGDFDEKLCESIQKFYVFLDFALYEDEMRDCESKHDALRSSHEKFISTQSAMYDKIAIYREKINQIDDKLKMGEVECRYEEQPKKEYHVDTIKNSDINPIQSDEIIEDKDTRIGITGNKLKDFLSGTLGIFGIILYMVINALLAFIPVYIVPLPSWLTFIIVFVALSAPSLYSLIAPLFYGWAMYVVLTEPYHWTNIIFWISFAIWVLTSFIPTLIQIFSCFSNKND